VDKTTFFREKVGLFMKLSPIAKKFDLGFFFGFLLALLGFFIFIQWQH